MSFKTAVRGLIVVAGLSSLIQVGHAGDVSFASGQILGEVTNPSGVVQMGASVFLYNAYDQLVGRALTNDEGKFAFESLLPGSYSLRVTLASFLPARRAISVLAGSENRLKVNLASIISTIDLVSTTPSHGTLMSDDWKWVLRSSPSTRPVLRLTPASSSSSKSLASMFSDTTGMVRVSTSDSDLFSGGLQQDLGTSFALATSVNGASRVRVSGNFGSAASGLPSAGFSTTYSPSTDGSAPQMTLTMRQIYFPTGNAGLGSDAPALRTASLSVSDHLDVNDHLRLEYGSSFDSISLYGRINYFSPFARASYNAGDLGLFQLGYSSGAAPTTLSNSGDSDLNRDLAMLGQLPHLSRRDNRAAIENTTSYEVGYQIERGGRVYAISAFQDDIRNAAFLMSGSTDLFGPGDLLPDLNSRGIVFNLGDVRRTGFGASVTQSIGSRSEIAIAGGRADALIPEDVEGTTSGADALRAGVHKSPRPWATVRAATTLPVTGTHLGTSYGWTDYNALMPVHFSLTGRSNQQEGWNISVRQPLPKVAGTRMEVMGEMRNMLAQGYLTVRAQGRSAILTNSPRAFRGGVSFIF